MVCWSCYAVLHRQLPADEGRWAIPRIGWQIGKNLLSHDEVLRLAAEPGGLLDMPPAAWEGLWQQTRRVDGPWFSPSSVNQCPRKRILQYTEDYYLKPEGLWAMSNGSAWHGWLDAGGEQHEIELYSPLVYIYEGENGEQHEAMIEVSGKTDHINPETGVIEDFKTIGKWHDWRGVEVALPKEDHVAQLNIYAWLARRHRLPVTSARLWYFRWNSDAGKMERRLVPVELWSDETVYALVEDQAFPYLVAREHGILPDCTCRYQNRDSHIDLCKTVTDTEWLAKWQARNTGLYRPGGFNAEGDEDGDGDSGSDDGGSSSGGDANAHRGCAESLSE